MLYLRAIMRNWRAMISPYLWYYNSNVIRYELLLMIHGWKVLAYDIYSNIELVFDISNLNINLYEVDLFCSTNMYDKIICSFNSIQKRYLKIITNYLPWGHPNMWTIQQLYGDPVSLQIIFPGAIQTCEQYNNFSYIYTKQHTQTQLTLSYKNSYLTHTMYIQSCTSTTLSSFMHKTEQYIVSNKYVKEEPS